MIGHIYQVLIPRNSLAIASKGVVLQLRVVSGWCEREMCKLLDGKCTWCIGGSVTGSFCYIHLEVVLASAGCRALGLLITVIAGCCSGFVTCI